MPVTKVPNFAKFKFQTRTNISLLCGLQPSKMQFPKNLLQLTFQSQKKTSKIIRKKTLPKQFEIPKETLLKRFFVGDYFYVFLDRFQKNTLLLFHRQKYLSNGSPRRRIRERLIKVKVLQRFGERLIGTKVLMGRESQNI